MRLVIISDLHKNFNFHIPNGDILIVAGDICAFGSRKEVKAFFEFIKYRPHTHKIVVAGNHDICFQKHWDKIPDFFDYSIAHYLEDDQITIEGIKFYGSPWQPEFEDWAFNLPRGEALKDKWDMVPDDTDVLITHTPPAGILDQSRGIPVGCADLYEAVRRIKPKYHIFGHIHAAYGVSCPFGDTTFINASLCDTKNKVVRVPIVIDYGVPVYR